MISIINNNHERTFAIPAPRTRLNHTCHQHDHQSQRGNHVEINFQRRDTIARSFLRVKSFEDSLVHYEVTFEEETLHTRNAFNVKRGNARPARIEASSNAIRGP